MHCPRLPLMHLAVILVIACLSALSCGKLERAAAPGLSSAPAASPGPASVSGSRAEGSKQPDDKVPSSTPRKIVRNGEIHLVVRAYEPARQAIEDLVQRSGGYISSSQVHHSLGQVSSATIVLRVPAGQFGGIVRHLGRLGVVSYESTGSQDITEEYYDLRARLSNARKLEARLIELLAKSTGKVSDLLIVEKELARVREQIERLEGKLRLFDSLVDLSTLTLQLAIQEKYTPPVPPGLGEDVRRMLGDSWAALRSLGRGLLLLAVALLPWVIPLGLVLWIAVRLIQGWRARRAARRAAFLAARAAPPPPSDRGQ
jgi:hypothetical protein